MHIGIPCIQLASKLDFSITSFFQIPALQSEFEHCGHIAIVSLTIIPQYKTNPSPVASLGLNDITLRLNDREQNYYETQGIATGHGWGFIFRYSILLSIANCTGTMEMFTVTQNSVMKILVH